MRTPAIALAAVAALLLAACGSSGSAPGAPTNVSVSQTSVAGSVAVAFDAPTTGDAVQGYTVTATPFNLGGLPVVATGTSSPIVVTGLLPRTGYTFSVVAANTSGVAATNTGLLRFYSVVETFHEPMTQPNDSIFTGSFTYDVTNQVVSNLQGGLTQSMTKNGGVYGPPMTVVALDHQLSAVATTLGGVQGLLVTTFHNDSTNVFDPSGFAPGGTQYYGLTTGQPNPHNAYAMIFVNLADPTTTLAQAQIDKLAYGDCTAGGMMMNTCMTGTTMAGYGRMGTMMGVPVSQVITEQ